VSFKLSVSCAECHLSCVTYADCHIQTLYAEFRYAECRGITYSCQYYDGESSTFNLILRKVTSPM